MIISLIRSWTTRVRDTLCKLLSCFFGKEPPSQKALIPQYQSKHWYYNNYTFVPLSGNRTTTSTKQQPQYEHSGTFGSQYNDTKYDDSKQYNQNRVTESSTTRYKSTSKHSGRIPHTARCNHLHTINLQHHDIEPSPTPTATNIFMLSKDNLPVFINRPPTAPVTRKSDSNYVISQIKEHTQKKGKKRSETSRQRRLRRKRQKDKGASIDNKSIVFNDNDVKYTTMRTKAHQALILKITMKKKCVEAFKDGNKKLGNELLAVSRTHHSEMIKLNKQAADHKYNEINKGRPSTVIDLHGLFISEAREKVKTAIEKCRRENKPEMILIVGNGNHSHDKVSKLKPAMITYVESLKLRCIPNKPNSGCLLIQLVSL